MDSGAPFLVTQLSGVASTFSYTPAAGVWLCVTGVGGYAQTLYLGAVSSPYIYGYMRAMQEGASGDNNNIALKKIIGNGTGVFGSGSNITNYGIALGGIEI